MRLPPSVREVLSTRGAPLEASARELMESRFGHDFANVRVHADAHAAESARAVNAQAYTVGENVVFGTGKYQPATSEGRRLLAHELTHVVQQSGQTTQPTAPVELSQPGDAAEQEAEEAAQAVHAAQPVSLSSKESLRVARLTPDQPLTAQTGISAAVYKLKFSRIGPLPMENMLEELEKLSRDELLTLRQNSEASAAYGRERLELAMDAVWHRKFARAVLPEFRMLLQDRMNRVIPFADQQKAIMRFLNAAAIERSEKQAAATASAKGAAQPAQTAASGQGAIPADQLSAFGTDEQTAFKRQVYNAQMKLAMRVKTFFPGLPAEEMEVVEKGQKMRKDAAKACKKLLEQARADLKKQQDESDELAQKVASIGAGSAYRDPATDFKIWDGLFQKYYNETQEKRAEMEGGEHGSKAVQFLAGYISQYKAVAGFSNHSSGIAMDFITTEGKETLGADKSQNPRWKKSWLHKWLVENAATFGFQPLSTEAWHWDYRGVQDAEGRPDSK